MPVTINGGAGVTFPDGVQQTNAVTNTGGSPPYYAARAWVNFNGTGTVAIRAAVNVSSITDNATGNYTVNFTTAMPDANYVVSLATVGFDTGTNQARNLLIYGSQSSGAVLKSTTQLQIVRGITSTSSAPEDTAEANVIIFR